MGTVLRACEREREIGSPSQIQIFSVKSTTPACFFFFFFFFYPNAVCTVQET